MATEPGLFAGLGKYEAELIDDATQREASSADVGTGWAAMTNAAGRAGGMIGRSVGRGLGGVTTAEKRVADFQAITASMPDFNANKVEDLQAMSSAMWRGGFYEQAQDMMNTANIYQRNLAEVAKIEAETTSIEFGDSLEEMRFKLSERFTVSQMNQIDATISQIKSGISRDDLLAELKKDYTAAQILEIEQVIEASIAGVEIAKQQLDLSERVGEAQIKEINQQVLNLQSQVGVNEQDILQSQETILASKAVREGLGLTDMARNFEFAQENGNYDGTFEDYQKLMANLKTVATEGSINLYNFARTKAGGSYEGTLEEFITSVTGVDYKLAVREGDKYKTTFYDYTTKKRTALESFLNENIDRGGATGLIADIGNVEGAAVLGEAAGDYTVEQIGEHLFQMGLNAGKDPKQVWEFYLNKSAQEGGNVIDFIMNQPIMKTLSDYKKWEAPKGGGADAGGGGGGGDIIEALNL